MVIAAVSAFNMDMQACCAAVALACLIIDRRVLIGLDVSLLATSMCFFVFLGNLKQIDSVSSFISSILTGREVLASALASQIISNVPAAIMLSDFTNNAHALLPGTNIGGLGTPIASPIGLLVLLLLFALIFFQPCRQTRHGACRTMQF